MCGPGVEVVVSGVDNGAAVLDVLFEVDVGAMSVVEGGFVGGVRDVWFRRVDATWRILDV